MAVLSFLSRGASGADEAADATRAAFDFSDEPARVKVPTYIAGEGVNQVSRTADAAGGAIASTAKYTAGGAVGATGLYAGSQAYQARQDAAQVESRNEAFQDYSEAAEEILSNPNLSAEQKEEALNRLQDAYEDAGGDGSGGLLSRFQDLGLVEKVIIGLILLAVVRGVLERT